MSAHTETKRSGGLRRTMILVTGAAGKTGLAVIKALSARGLPVRGLVKEPRLEVRVRDAGAQSAVDGDMEEAAVWARALRGIGAVYHIAPNMHPRETQMGRLALRAASSAGVQHFVFHSVLHPQTESMPHHWQKLRVEEMLLQSGLPFTIMQPAAYMQNILSSWRSITEEGVYRVPYPASTQLSLVHLEDVAEAAAIVLTETGHNGATYELAGTRPLVQTEVAAILSGALSRDVRAEKWDLGEWRSEAQRQGVSGYALQSLLAMFRDYAKHGFAGNPNVLRWLLGRRPRSLEDFAREAIVAS